MLASILSFLKALPEMVGLIKDLSEGVKALNESFKRAQTEKWINHGKEVAKRVSLAKTDKERAKLAKELTDLWDSQP